MKPKIIYCLLLMSCTSVFSSAEQCNNKCTRSMPVQAVAKQEVAEELEGRQQESSGLEYSPMNFFIINF